jgi:hypothetical protein
MDTKTDVAKPIKTQKTATASMTTVANPTISLNAASNK